jgi:uncharacterized membrane protein
MFWLSHHPPEELDRCFKLGPVHVCARCLGAYPVMFAAIALQFALKAPLEHPLDLPAGVALVVPAVADWALGRFRPHAFSNLWRFSTGILLGLGLSRSLFIHLQKPLPPVLLWQLGLSLGVAIPVFLVTYGRSRMR